MSRFERYEHHGVMVAVDKGLKGKHRDHCLCWQGCSLFKPGEEDNCEIAQELYEFCVKYGMVTPVWECQKFDG